MIHPNFIEAIAYGDAKGLPYETRSREEIQKLGGVAVGLIVPDAHSDFKDFSGYPVGTWSDDTQHACVAAESISTRGKYDLKDIALRLKVESQNALGWGNTTRRAVARINSNMSHSELVKNGELKGKGCGPLMRSAPLAIFASICQPKLIESIALENAGLTHLSPENALSTLVHHKVINYLVQTSGSPNTDTFLAYAIDWSVVGEKQLGAEPYLSQLLIKLYKSDLSAIEYYDTKNKWKAFTTWVVQAMAYGAFLRRMHEALDVVVTDCIEQGGDTDSSASISASLWALANPDKELPTEVALLQNRERIISAQLGYISVINQNF